MQQDEKISIGIVFYKNDADEIASCLNSLSNQSAKDRILEVLVRDQGGGKSNQIAREWLAENHVLQNVKFFDGENLGFGGGHNSLFSELDGQSTAYLCLNPDGIMHPSCLDEMLKVAQKNEWKGIVEAIQEPVMHPKVFSPQTGVTAWCSGACLLIPSDIYREISGYDEDFFLYCEDVDLSWRVKAAGYQCFTAAEAWLFHYAMDRTARVVEIWKSACILAHKWRSTKFKKHAINVLASLVDIHCDELQRDVERHEQRSLEDVYRASPDFKNNLTFSDAMWM